MNPHKQVYLIGLGMILATLAVVVSITASRVAETTETQTTNVVQNKPETETPPLFTTVIDPRNDTKDDSEVSNEFVPTHASDILKSVPFEQRDYVALLNPNDPLLPAWFHTSINAPAAWDITTGSQDTIIAVIDSGFALNHVELANGWYVNPGESGQTTVNDSCWTGTPANKQSNGCDDDNNGYVDDWRGWDFFSIDNDPQAGSQNPNGDGVSHGSLVSGLIRAEANNSFGMAGVDWNAKIMPLQALSDDGWGTTSDIVAAVEYAVDNGADVINLSLGGGSADTAMEAALKFAESQGVVVVAASGNCASLAYPFCSQLPGPGYMTYPAVYESVIAVGAVNSSGTRAPFSSYGSSLDIVAPGWGVSSSTTWLSTNQTTAISGSISGTSFAAPIVSGVVGLLVSAKPDLPVAAYAQSLWASTGSPSFFNEYGYGRLNARGALDIIRNDLSATNRFIEPLLAETAIYTNPATPVSIGTQVTTRVSSFPGDTVSLMAIGPSNTRIALGEIKIDETGQADLSWSSSPLQTGVWQIQPTGSQASGQTHFIYATN